MRNISIERISKKENGITLVALIITVIVLIILAAISINALVSGGFINLAVKSTQDYANAQEYEGGVMQNYTNLLEQVVSNLTSKYVSLGSSDVSPKNYGEYVDLGIDLNGENGSLDDWQIFYRDEQNRVFLISADCIPTSKITSTMQSQAGLTMPSKYGVSWQSAPASYNCYDGKNEANNTKAQCIFPDIFLSKNYSIADHSTGDKQYANSLCVSKLLCNDIWKNLVSGTPKASFVQYVSGSPTLEMWAKSWNAKYGAGGSKITEEDVGITVDGEDAGEYGYYITRSDYSQSLTNSKGYIKAKAENEEEKDNLYFPHTGPTDGCSGYFLASPSALLQKFIIKVAYNGELGTMSHSDYGYGLRPIIVLDSKVVLRQATEDGRTFYSVSDR